jgi:hypothetical protein
MVRCWCIDWPGRDVAVPQALKKRDVQFPSQGNGKVLAHPNSWNWSE